MKIGKNKKSNPRLRYIILGSFIFLFLVLALIFNTVRSNRDIEKWEKYMLVGKKNIFVVYGDKLVVKIPFEISIDKDVTFKDLAKVKNYEEMFNRVNSILPEKVDHYKVTKFGEIDLNIKNSRNIPEVMINEKRHILTSSTESMFNKLLRDRDTKDIANENIIVDILNANGISGHARKTGEKLTKDLGVKFTAANYETNSEQSYVIIKDLPREKVEELVMSINEKYLKIKDGSTVPTLANVVFVLGKEREKVFNVEVVGDSATAGIYVDTLKKEGYNDVTRKKVEVKGTDTLINYSDEDYYIAYKIAKKLGITKLVEKKGLKDKIVVVVE